ncbi:LytR/AlgR family response regulator transcription factor [Chitinophaga vietnamensis]|uniref:LytR/AlgR family response regulator transcription factor n=1 Tax=Chitinophaga vietnamensis TaxID=2593957 RepID=UPI001177AD18|nr:LytTR family DNA-binding domain-containing protein [Chitinophaga vietnamensis]
MIRCIAVDDEKLVRDLLEDNIRQVPFLQLVATCKNALEANEVLQSETVDLMFLDIQMPRLSGLQLLQSLMHPPLAILVTAYEQYALEGFELQVADYLLKPFSFERFLKACNRAKDLLRLRESKPREVTDFFVNVEYTLVKIVVADIEYIEGLKDYIKIYLSSAPKPVLTRMTMKAIEEKLPATGFIRTHKSYLVAASKITTIKRDLVCIGEKEIPVSEFYKENVTRLLNG